MKVGKDFEDRIARRLTQAGCHVQKLYDAPAAFGSNRDVLQGLNTTFTPKNPYDFIVILSTPQQSFNRHAADSMPSFFVYALELKTKSVNRLDLKDVKPHQIKGLKGFPGVAGVVVELRAVKRCFFVSPEVVASWEVTHGKKSMNLADLESNAVELPINTTGRESRDYYDVTPILAGVKK